MMILLYLEPVPPRTTKGEILHFLMTAGGIRREQVGRIDLRGATAVVEVPPGWETRLVKALDGAALKNRRLRAWSTAGPDSPSAGEDHFQRLARLLNLEAEAEARQILEDVRRLPPAEAERGGDCLAGLVLVEES